MPTGFDAQAAVYSSLVALLRVSINRLNGPMYTMNHWLVKTEPDKYGWHHFTQQGRAVWDGVRNYQARNNLNAMRLGDAVLYYHSVSNPGVVGLATVVREAYPDPTVPNGLNATPERWVVVELEPVMALEKPVSLAQIKAEPLLATIGLIRQSRLSVMPIRPDAFELILRMGYVSQPPESAPGFDTLPLGISGY